MTIITVSKRVSDDFAEHNLNYTDTSDCIAASRCIDMNCYTIGINNTGN